MVLRGPPETLTRERRGPRRLISPEPLELLAFTSTPSLPVGISSALSFGAHTRTRKKN